MAQFIAGHLIKQYHVDNLLDPDWEDRAWTIEKISKRHELIPPIIFTREKHGAVIYSQRRISRKPIPFDFIRQHLSQLAENLSNLADDGFVHGDINFKNLMFDGTAFRLIDLEPSLRQCRKGRVTLMYTPPYIARDDFVHDRLTLATDKVGFYFFCRRILNPIPCLAPHREMRMIAGGFSIIERFTGIDETSFCRQPYIDVLELAVTSAATACRNPSTP